MLHSTSRGRFRPLKSLPTALLVAVLVALVGLVAVEVGSGRWQARPVLTGSMRPGFSVGSLAVLQREPVSYLQVRDVILVTVPHDGGFQIVHRVISLQPAPRGPIIRTMGDDNPVPDPWGAVQVRSRYVYVARFTIPLVGYVALAVHSPRGRQISAAVAVLLALLALATQLTSRRKKARDRGRGETPTAGEEPQVLAEPSPARGD